MTQLKKIRCEYVAWDACRHVAQDAFINACIQNGIAFKRRIHNYYDRNNFIQKYEWIELDAADYNYLRLIKEDLFGIFLNKSVTLRVVEDDEIDERLKNFAFLT
jgi:hypothetical protein